MSPAIGSIAGVGEKERGNETKPALNLQLLSFGKPLGNGGTQSQVAKAGTSQKRNVSAMSDRLRIWANRGKLRDAKLWS